MEYTIHIGGWQYTYNDKHFANLPVKEFGTRETVYFFNGPDTVDAIVFCTHAGFTYEEALQVAVQAGLLAGWEVNHADLPVYAEEYPDAITWINHVAYDFEELRCEYLIVEDFLHHAQIAAIFA